MWKEMGLKLNCSHPVVGASVPLLYALGISEAEWWWFRYALLLRVITSTPPTTFVGIFLHTPVLYSKWTFGIQVNHQFDSICGVIPWTFIWMSSTIATKGGLPRNLVTFIPNAYTVLVKTTIPVRESRRVEFGSNFAEDGGLVSCAWFMQYIRRDDKIDVTLEEII